MMLVKGGDMTIMDENLTMTDGTKVMTDGTILLVDGTSITLVEGEGMMIDAPVATADQTDL
jgi:hypothetical protein